MRMRGRITSCTSCAMRTLNALNRRLASRTSESHSMYGRAGLLVRQYSSLNAAQRAHHVLCNPALHFTRMETCHSH